MMERAKQRLPPRGGNVRLVSDNHGFGYPIRPRPLSSVARATAADVKRNKKDTTMKHMIIDIRNRIEFLIGCGFAVPKVAKDIGRDPSTVRNELLKHRIASDKGYGCSNRLCAHFDECTRTSFDGFGDRKRKCQPK